MGQTQNLPIYTSSYKFVREIFRLKIKLPKVLKHDLGQESFLSSLKILKCIIIANKIPNKGPHISRLLLEVETLWTFLRLLFDLRGISEGEFKVVSEKLVEIEKQAQAWLRWDRKENGQTRQENISIS